jgi:hypothetical protein
LIDGSCNAQWPLLCDAQRTSVAEPLPLYLYLYEQEG